MCQETLRERVSDSFIKARRSKLISHFIPSVISLHEEGSFQNQHNLLFYSDSRFLFIYSPWVTPLYQYTHMCKVPNIQNLENFDLLKWFTVLFYSSLVLGWILVQVEYEFMMFLSFSILTPINIYFVNLSWHLRNIKQCEVLSQIQLWDENI